jgi:maleylpyruvate isomerase
MAYVRDVLKGDDKAFTKHFVALGLANLQALAAPLRGRYLFGDSVTLADCFLIPQLFGARRFGVDVAAYPALLEIEAECLKLPAFVKAAADQQPDAQP